MESVVVDRIKRVTFEEECCNHIYGTWESPGYGWAREEWKAAADAVEYAEQLYWETCERLVGDMLGRNLQRLDELGAIVEDGRIAILEWLFPELVRVYTEIMYL